MTIGDRMKKRRKELKISADIVAKELGVSRSTVFRYEKGEIEKLPTNILDKIASILQTTPGYLMGWDNDSKDIAYIYYQLDDKRQAKVYNFAEAQLEEQRITKTKVVPMVGKVAANPTELAYGDPTYDEAVANVPNKADCALLVQGDSMEPEFKNGQIIFYKRQEVVENGELAVVEIDGSGVTFKKICIDYENEKIVLKSLNRKYEERILDSNRVKVIGKVIK